MSRCIWVRICQETGVRPHLAGICAPGLFAFGLARMALALVEKAKVLVTVFGHQLSNLVPF